MKRVGQLYDRIASHDNLRLAWWKARRRKSLRPDVLAFGSHLEEELAAMGEALRREEVAVGDYHCFRIFDPKERQICAAPFRERVLHHAVMNLCEPVFESRQVAASHACRQGRGTRAALEQARRLCRRHTWFLKLDVRKYFDSIEHRRLNGMLARLFKDRPLLKLLERIVASYETSPGRGLPIGSLTSQFFANHYLSPLDRLVQERLRLPGYVRYMDDFVLFADEPQALRQAAQELERFARDELGLELKPPCLHRTARGLPFLGYRIHPGWIGLSARSRRRYLDKTKDVLAAWRNGEDEGRCACQAQALVAFTENAGAAGTAFRRRAWPELWDAIQTGANRVNRGGSWNNNARNCRAANRNRNEPGNRNNNLGFRVALAPAPAAQEKSRRPSVGPDGIPAPGGQSRLDKTPAPEPSGTGPVPGAGSPSETDEGYGNLFPF